MKRLLTVLITVSLCLTLGAQENEELNCFGIIAGRNATTDGSVLFGHNEDDSGEQMLNVYMVPSASQQPVKTTVSTEKRANNRYIWAEFPRMDMADAYMNEYGVCIASDGCSSKEDRDDFTDGGLLYEVRTNVARYARSSREAAMLIGEMVEKYGYRGSGRTYLIADPVEGWIVSVVKGRHWVAQRVPDDKVMIIPNYYVIGKVDLSDNGNFLGSADIVEYAKSRGWYNPGTDGQFSFRNAYAGEKTIKNDGNITRHRKVLNFITDSEYNYSWKGFETMVKPARKISKEDIITALSTHNDTWKEGDEKAHHGLVCNNSTILCTVFQLRNNMPLEIGCVMWAAAGKPCSEVFIPWYLGMTKSPDGFTRFATPAEAYEKHFTDCKQMRINYPDGYYWKLVDRWAPLKDNYSDLEKQRKDENSTMQKVLFSDQTSIEEMLLKLSEREREDFLNKYTEDCYTNYMKLF